MTKGRLFLLLLVGVLATTLMVGCGESNTINLGAIQPISGQVSAYGTQTRDAINMAVDEINAKGGILGKKIKMFVEDDENSPDKTKNAFKKLVAQNKVVGIVGALTSKCSLAITQEAQLRKVILITPASTNETVVDAGDYIFRACYNDSFQGVVVAQYAAETLKTKKAAILYDVTNDYSKGLATNFKKKFESLGGKIVATESYSTNDKDFNAQLTKIKATQPEVLFIPDYYSTISLIAKQVRAQGMKIPMVGADGWDEITNNAGSEVIDCYYSNHFSPDANDPDVTAFVKKYEEKFKITPNALAALGYDATYILAEAIQRAGSTDPEKIKAAMMETNRKFVTGNIKFNAKHNPVKSAIMLRIVKGANGKLTTQFAGVVNP
ncbi:MAG TPA: ABC transporter substrate-binding protein [Bacillota bacterium]|nr:ABC transporter substrate-binding protein [Bacillota bacterium]